MTGVPISGGSFLVTGGSGFIGSHVVDALLAAGAAHVNVFDVAASEDRLEDALASGRVAFLQGDILDRDALGSATEACDGVFHLATRSLPECLADPAAGVETNVVGTVRVLEAATASGARKVVFSSASSVYGETEATMDENMPLAPQTPYGATKAAAEFTILAREPEIAGVILRYMNVYGPRQQGGLVPSVIARVRAGEAPVIAGDGSQSFDFVHVFDVAAANLAAMAADVRTGAFNVGSGGERSVAELVLMVLALIGSNLEPVFDVAQPVVTKRRAGSSRLAAEVLGWKTRVTLEDGLRGLL